MNHKCNVGDRVMLKENGEEGTITKQVLSQQVDEDMDPNEPWYQIDWDVGFNGQEHKDSLV